MSTLDPSLEAVLNQFTKQSGVSADQVAQLLDVFNKYSNLLLEPFTEYAKAGQLTSFAIAKVGDQPNRTGTYDPLTGVVTFPANSFEAKSQATSGDLSAAVILQGMVMHLAHQTYQDERGATQTVSPEMICNLQSVLNEGPTIAREVKQAVLAGKLREFRILDTGAGVGGRYEPASRAMLLLADDLADPQAPKTFAAGQAPNLAFVLGHEIHHALNRNYQVDASGQFIDAIESVAISAQRDHDYSGPVRTMLEECRWDEASAEIAGWNALLDKVRADNPDATLKDVFDAEPDRTSDFVELDSATDQYRAKPGLNFNADLTLSDTKENVEAMGRYYFDQPAAFYGLPEPSMDLGIQGGSDYRNQYGKDLVSRIISAERVTHPKNYQNFHMELAMCDLGLDGTLMERNGFEIKIHPEKPQRYYDTSKPRGEREYFHDTMRQQKSSQGTAATSSAEDTNSPRHALHRDHAQYQSIRSQTRELFAAHGIALDDERLERTTAAIVRDVKAQGMTRVAHMEFGLDRVTGNPDPHGYVIASSEHPQKITRFPSITSVAQAQQTSAEQTYLQLGQMPGKDQHIDQSIQLLSVGPHR